MMIPVFQLAEVFCCCYTLAYICHIKKSGCTLSRPTILPFLNSLIAILTSGLEMTVTSQMGVTLTGSYTIGLYRIQPDIQWI